VRDIDTTSVDSLKVLDPNRPIREADIVCRHWSPIAHQLAAASSIGGADGGVARGLSSHFQIWMTAF
jgi:hypothetical protein